jgi:allantoate deiminase
MTDNSALPDGAQAGAEIMVRADAIAVHNDGAQGVTRRFLSSQHRAAADMIIGWMRDAGMDDVWLDNAGNVVGRYEGAEPGLPALITGSHQDTVSEGGRYDGMLGVLTPIACVAAMSERGERLPYAIEVVAIGDEEGLRFNTGLFGSQALAGALEPSELSKSDSNGVTVAQALRDFDLDPDAIGAVARRPEDVLAYVELHIEQGPILEAEGLAMGVVTAITGSINLTVTINGTAGHAGTVPMTRRNDALAAAAEAILAVERNCSGQEGLVGTVGTISVGPDATNVIPGVVRFSVDLRSGDAGRRATAVTGIKADIAAICERRRVTADIENLGESTGCACAPWLMDQLETAVTDEGLPPRRLFSGAGHDAQAMNALTDVGMLFLRCKAGVSHNPDEAITAEDAGTGVRVMLRFLRSFKKKNALENESV